MPFIPRRHVHFVFGAIQSGLTSLIVPGIAGYPMLARGMFFSNWMKFWLFAAPGIRWL
jgi:hypothetical protein